MTDRPLDPDALRYARYWEPVLAPSAFRVLDRLPGPPTALLDLGAGTGSLTLEAAARWPEARLVAVDASGATLAVARARARERGFDPARFRWLPADALDLPLADASVDATVCSFVLQLVEDRAALLREVRRVLRPGGTFSFVTWLAGELQLAADTVYDEVLAELGHEPEQGHFRPPLATDHRSVDEPRAELLAAGFSSVEVHADELRVRWTREEYLELKERYDDPDRFEALDAAARARLRERLTARWAELPDEAFELHSPLVAGTARTPPARVGSS